MIVTRHTYSDSRNFKNAGLNACLPGYRVVKHAVPVVFLLLFCLANRLCGQGGDAVCRSAFANNYGWLDDQTNLENKFLLAGRFGLNFCEYLEICGSYPKQTQLPGLDPVLCFRKKSGGFHGLRLLLEPAIARLNFHHELPYRNTWMAGAYAGVDFNPYLGFRGFIFKAMNDGKIKLDFDKLYLYGGEFRLRPNIAKGLTPSLMLGGGYLRVNDRYIPRDGESRVGNQFFAQGGFGLMIPITDCLHVVGGARAVLSANGSAAENRSAVRASCMYNFGIKLAIGKRVHYP